MSSATTVAAADDAVMVADTVEKAPRRFPPPCWTQEETLVLIEAYRERWYALRRGYLRTADWDAVAAAVASRCPGASPAKTSAQCRHKMEKLRQRYRAEKQRALSFPYPAGRYFSSWFFFENMEAMENGTAPPTGVQKPENSADGSRLKSLLDQNILKLKLKAKNNADTDPDSGHENGIKSKRFSSGTKILTEYTSYLNTEISRKAEEDSPHNNDDINFGSRQQLMNGIPKPPFKSKANNPAKMFENFNIGGGFHQEMLPPIKKIGKFDPSMDPDGNRRNPAEEFWVRIPNNNRQYWTSSNPNSDSRAPIQESKRRRNALEEIVASIKSLGEGFVRMERAKMEMAREMEAVRMDMEMKRNEMLLESQKQIVDAFLKGLFEMKKSKKVKITADSAEQ